MPAIDRATRAPAVRRARLVAVTKVKIGCARDESAVSLSTIDNGGADSLKGTFAGKGGAGEIEGRVEGKTWKIVMTHERDKGQSLLSGEGVVERRTGFRVKIKGTYKDPEGKDGIFKLDGRCREERPR